MVGDRRGGHRHDGASPLPLGMDASPAPPRWTGGNTIWPHDPRSGWSFCVMIPSWIALPDSQTAATSDVSSHAANSTVFFRVLTGIQSPEGVSTLHGILRRFSDFMKLNDSLKRTFPKKKLPMPPRKSLRQINHSKHHLQQRRLALSEWMVKLLGDIDVSRSAPIASFLELDDAAKAAKPDTDRRELQTWLRKGIDKEVQTQQSGNDFSEAEDNFTLTDTTSIHEGAMADSTSLNALGGEKQSSWHGRRHSIDSDASELSFTSASELSSAPLGDGRDPFSEGLPSLDGEISKAVQALLPIDQRGNVRRVLATLQRRVTTATADMEDLAARLNQETTVKEFLSTKVKYLEVELSKVKQKSTESLQQAVYIEREGYMSLQWELEESRVALARAVEEARLAQEGRTQTEVRLQAAELENRRVEHALSEMREKLRLLQVDRDNIKAKAVAEAKVLVKEIKVLRKSQPELKQNLEAALRANKELEAWVQQQQKQKESRVKTLREVGALRERLQQCTVDSLAKEDARGGKNNAAVTDAADLLMTSDSRIGLLIAEAQLLAEEEDDEDDDDDDDELTGETLKVTEANNEVDDDGGRVSQVTWGSVELMRKMLTDIFVDNAHLHKLVNSLTLKALLVDSKQEKVQVNEAAPRKSVLYRFL